MVGSDSDTEEDQETSDSESSRTISVSNPLLAVVRWQSIATRMVKLFDPSISEDLLLDDLLKRITDYRHLHLHFPHDTLPPDALRDALTLPIFKNLSYAYLLIDYRYRGIKASSCPELDYFVENADLKPVIIDFLKESFSRDEQALCLSVDILWQTALIGATHVMHLLDTIEPGATIEVLRSHIRDRRRADPCFPHNTLAKNIEDLDLFLRASALGSDVNYLIALSDYGARNKLGKAIFKNIQLWVTRLPEDQQARYWHHVETYNLTQQSRAHAEYIFVIPDTRISPSFDHDATAASHEGPMP